jgi:hypothetical protein
MTKVGEPDSIVTTHVPQTILLRIVLQATGEAIPEQAIIRALHGVENEFFGRGCYNVANAVIPALCMIGVTLDNLQTIEKGIYGWQAAMASRLPAARAAAATAEQAKLSAKVDREIDRAMRGGR